MGLDKRLTPREARSIPGLPFLFGIPRVMARFVLFSLRVAGFILKKTGEFPSKMKLERLVGAYKWRAFLWRDLDLIPTRDKADFKRVALAKGVLLFKNTAGANSLLIAFTPRTSNFARTNQVFLAATAQAECDVLMIRPKAGQSSPWRDLEEASIDFRGLCELLQKTIDVGGYQDSRVLGLSYSAPLALAIGLILHVREIVPVGFTQTYEQWSIDYPEAALIAKESRDSQASWGATEITWVVGERSGPDREKAQEAIHFFPGSNIMLVFDTGHNPLPRLHLRRELAQFCSSLMSGFAQGTLSKSCRIDQTMTPSFPSSSLRTN